MQPHVEKKKTVSSEKSHQQKNKSLSRGNPTTFKQINMCLYTHKHLQKCSASPAHTNTHTHTHTDTHVHHSLPERGNTVDCNSHPVWAKPEISSRGETPGSSIAPNYWGLEAESTASVLYNHVVWEEISPLSLLLWAMRCRPGLQQKPLKLSYSAKMTWALCGKRILYNFAEKRPQHYSFSCNTFSEIKRMP